MRMVTGVVTRVVMREATRVVVANTKAIHVRLR